jgi:hypothetical protein
MLLGAVPATAQVAPTAAGRAPSLAVRAGVPLASAPLPYSFVRKGFTFVPLPMGRLPYWSSSQAPGFADDRPHNAAGVRHLVVAGRSYDYPVGQASRGIEMLDGYRLTKNSRYLAIALANANRLVATKIVDTSVVSDGAWFWPHRYPFALHRAAGSQMPNPFYSAMAQGKVLSLFSRLARVTRAARWRTAAKRVFASFLVPRRAGRPWVVDSDTGHHVWLEEWASPSGHPTPDRTFNGHNFAAVGLYDYLQLTPDPRARDLLDGALTSTLDRLPTVRDPGWISHYCRRNPSVRSGHYHATHIGQLLWFYDMTGDARFAADADQLEADYPRPEVTGTIWLAPGRHLALRFDASDRPVGSVAVRLRRATYVAVDQRARIHHRGGAWWHVTKGPLAGTWLQERAGSAFRRGALVRMGYRVPRTALLPAKRTLLLVKLAANGQVARRMPVVLPAALRGAVTLRGTVDGIESLRLSGGPYDRWWVPAAAVRLDVA